MRLTNCSNPNRSGHRGSWKHKSPFPHQKTTIETALLCVACVIGDMKATAATNAFFAVDNGVGRGQWPPAQQSGGIIRAERLWPLRSGRECLRVVRGLVWPLWQRFATRGSRQQALTEFYVAAVSLAMAAMHGMRGVVMPPQTGLPLRAARDAVTGANGHFLYDKHAGLRTYTGLSWGKLKPVQMWGLPN